MTDDELYDYATALEEYADHLDCGVNTAFLGGAR